MAENGNRGPNDFRRSGKRRREPPIIDAAATEVPVEPAATDVSVAANPDAPSASEPRPTAGMTPAGTDATPVAGDEPVDAPAVEEPVLFGSAMRDAARRNEAGEPVASAEPEPAPSPEAEVPAVEPAPAEAASASDQARVAEPLDPQGVAPMPSAGSAEPPRAGEPPPSMPSRPSSGSNGLVGVLGVAALVLLGIIGWLVYSGGQRGGDLAATVADLKSRVSALEARPDPAALQAQFAALEKRISAADGDRAALGKQIAALTARIDSAGLPQQAAAGAGSNAQPDNGTAGQPGAATVATAAALAALAGKVDGLDSRVATLAGEQSGTAKALASLPKPVPPDFGPVDAKVAGLASELNTLDGKINGVDARYNGFDAKINGVEAQVNGFGATMNGLSSRMNGLEGKADDTASQLSKLRSDVLALPKVDLGPLRAADAALDGRLVAIETDLSAGKNGARVTEARAVGSADETQATRIALVGEAVRRRIADGQPYGSEVDALKALGADPKLVARLGPASGDGVPSLDALRSRWNGDRAAVLATEKPIVPAAGGAMNRLLASATSIVQVHKTGEAGGADTSALVGEVDAALARGDVAAALAAWGKLPAEAKTASQGWADAARSRVDAVAAAADLVNGAIATLGRAPS